jgi:flavodoxin
MLEKKSRDVVVRAGSHDVLFAADAHIDEMDVQSSEHTEQFDELLRAEDLILYGVETVHRETKQRGSRDFYESLSTSNFEMALAGGEGRGWISKDDLHNTEYLDSTRGKLKET